MGEHAEQHGAGWKPGAAACPGLFLDRCVEVQARAKMPQVRRWAPGMVGGGACSPAAAYPAPQHPVRSS